MLEVEDDLDRLPSELSTGTKRAIAIARALAQDPEAILYDERPRWWTLDWPRTWRPDPQAETKSFEKRLSFVTHDTIWPGSWRTRWSFCKTVA